MASSVSFQAESAKTDFTKLFIKEELTMTDDRVGSLCRSADVLEIGVRCWVKYDQFYYPAIIHELLGIVFEIELKRRISQGPFGL